MKSLRVLNVRVAEHTAHVAQAQASMSPRTLHRVSPLHPRGWYSVKPKCSGSGLSSATDSDEYPYKSSLEGGPANYDAGLVSLKVISANANRGAGGS